MLEKIWKRQKGEIGGEGIRTGCSYIPSVGLGSGISNAHLLLCWSIMKLYAARKGKGKRKKKKTHNLARGMLLLQKKKHRYQIKKVCLKTVHMPAPGDFKYLWFATFLIFKRSRDAAHRIWCKYSPCLTWLWLVNCSSSGEENADSNESEAHLAAGLMFFFPIP